MKSLIPWKNRERTTTPALWNDDWFDSAWEDSFKGLLSPFGKEFRHMPKVDVTEDKNEFVVKAEMPGMTEKEISLTWDNGVLHISGEKKSDKEEKSKNRYYRECSYGSFSRGIPLGDSVDWKEAKAGYKHGVLTVKLPKTENAHKAIEVKVN